MAQQDARVPPEADLRSGNAAHTSSCGERWEQLGAASDPTDKKKKKQCGKTEIEEKRSSVPSFCLFFALISGSFSYFVGK